jgi:hypothetical protein
MFWTPEPAPDPDPGFTGVTPFYDFINFFTLIITRLCLTNSFVTSAARRGVGQGVRPQIAGGVLYQYVEDDLWTGNEAIADASPYAVEAICQTEPRTKVSSTI